MNKKMNISTIRKTHQEAILHELVAEKTLSRSELARRLGLSKPAISDNLTPLIACGIVEELGEGESAPSGGRKPQLLRLNVCYRYIIAINLDAETPVFVLSNLLGEVLQEFKIAVHKNSDVNTQISVLEQGISLLINASDIEKEQVAFIAVCSPGAFDAEGNTIAENQRFGGINWPVLNLKERLTASIGIQTFVMNDTKAATLGLWARDLLGDTKNFLLLNCGFGIGIGLVQQGKLYEGYNSMAGEIFSYADRRHLNRGHTLEEEICKAGLISRCNKAIEDGEQTTLTLNEDGEVDFDSIEKAYLKDDAMVCGFVQDICEEICMMLCNYVNFIPVEKLVFYGAYASFGDRFKQCFEEKYAQYCHSPPEICLAPKDGNSGIYGVISRARTMLFKDVCADATRHKVNIINTF